MYHFITASKDATVYLQQPNQNTGLDEILEISKVYYGNIKDIARTLIQFNTTPLSQSISDGEIQLDNVTLVLREADTEEVPLDYTIYAYPVSQSWEMGKGTRFDNIETAGVTWNYREGDSSLEWLVENQFATDTTGSYEGLGGVWWNNVSASQDFEYETTDIAMDVKSIVQRWISGSIQNNGFILKHSFGVEEDTNDYGIIKLFGKETNTIHQPKLRIGWDDSSFSTGSLIQLTASDIKVGFSNFKKYLKVNTKPKLRVVGRELYPQKTFSSQFEYNSSNYLPETTYYQIRDYHSDDIIIPFSDYSKVSCDSNGNYFQLDLHNWEVERVYKIEIKVDRDGISEYFDGDYTFRVVE